MEQWQIDKAEADARKALKKQYPELGKIVRRKGKSKWEYGVVIMGNVDGSVEPVIRYDNQKENDSEQLFGLPFEYAPDYVLQHINIDGTLL